MKARYIVLGLIVATYGVCKLFGNCCWIDYTNNILKLTEPMQEVFSEFVILNGRAPNPDEKEKLLKKVGCKDVSTIYGNTDDFYCTYNWQKYTVLLGDKFFDVGGRRRPDSHGYFMKVRLGTSACSAGLFSNGKPEETLCSKQDCIVLKQ